jgi:hypothetical protein
VTDQTLNEKMMSEALDAIREEAERLLNYDSLSEAARHRLELVLINCPSRL